jgi:hypothetical protein
MSRSEILTVDNILDMTEGGRLIFEKEVGPIYDKIMVSAPWRSDSDSSLQLREFPDKWMYMDYGGDQTSGSAIEFVQKFYGLEYGDAIRKIKQDFGLSAEKRVYKAVAEKPKLIEVPLLYEFNDRPFTKQHHRYWNRYALSEDFVTEVGDIYAVKIWAVNKVAQRVPEDEIMFAYVYRDASGKETGELKFLRIGPNVPKQFKWRTNVPNNSLWYLYKYANKDVDKLLVVKSNKDALCNLKQHLPSVATQSENATILTGNIPLLQEYTKSLILNFGADPQGRKASQDVAEAFQLEEFYTPTYLVGEGINDNAEYVAEFGEEMYIQLLKGKKLL